MKVSADLLYTIFEQHLLNTLVEEEANEQFVERVVADYVRLLKARGNIPHGHQPAIEADLREEVIEMMRKKTYGHYSLAEYRKAKGLTPKGQSAAAPENRKRKPRRARRSC